MRGYSACMNTSSLSNVALAALVVLAVAGCAQTASKTAPPKPVGMANPASVHCVQAGGKLRLVQTSAGEQGICTLPDGTEVEEWTLFRRDHPVK